MAKNKATVRRFPAVERYARCGETIQNKRDSTATKTSWY